VSVAAHLGIDLAEYDARIRTFIPDYEEMLDVAASAVPRRARTIVDLGTGTGGLSRRCLDRVPRARIVGIDADADVLAIAAERLGPRATFIAGTFGRTAIPSCDAIVSSLALHHVRTRSAKLTLYRRLRSATRAGGRVVSVDCYPARDSALALEQHHAWRAHLRRTYDARTTATLFRAWARDDRYMSLEAETEIMTAAGFRVEVLWRKGAFAVLVAQSRATRSTSPR
jgi:tRNA (cmo5U34)-methyltransferase